MDCKNCGKIVDGKFCSECGQHSKVGKINLYSLVEEISSSVLQVDKGILYTCKELLIRPGYCIKEFLNGERKNHFKPLAYVFAFSTVYFLIARLTGENTWMNDFILGFTERSNDTGTKIVAPSILIWLSENFAYSTLLLLPIFSFASFMSFRRLGRNYFEHIVINSYVTGQQAILYSIFIALKPVIDSEFLELIPVVLSVCYAFLVFWQLFPEENRIRTIFRSLATYVLYGVFCIVILSVFSVIQKFSK